MNANLMKALVIVFVFFLPLRLSHQPEKSVLGSPALMEPKTETQQLWTTANSFQLIWPLVFLQTYCVILPEGILGVAQQQFFGHKRAVQPDSPAETKRVKRVNTPTLDLCFSFKLPSPELQFPPYCWSFQSFHVVWKSTAEMVTILPSSRTN